jgi:hypothetical protein
MSQGTVENNQIVKCLKFGVPKVAHKCHSESRFIGTQNDSLAVTLVHFGAMSNLRSDKTNYANPQKTSEKIPTAGKYTVIENLNINLIVKRKTDVKKANKNVAQEDKRIAKNLCRCRNNLQTKFNYTA